MTNGANLAAGSGQVSIFADTWVPQTVGVYNATGLSGNASSNLLTSAPAGQYVVNIYVNQTTGCTTPSPGKVALNLSFTDSSGAQTKNPATLMFTSGATTTGASLVYSFWQATSGTIQASTTYTACMTGTATYDVHYTLTRVQ